MAKERKTRRRYFTAGRREAYLANLRRTGNHAAAAREAGISASAARHYRQRTPAYEAACAAASSEALARLAGAQGPEDGDLDPAFESIRRGADGRLKIQARGKRRWGREAEERFFDVLRECGNIAASARAAGVSREAVWKRRREWPAFARRMETALDEAEVNLEFRVACLGTNWSEEAEAAGDEDAPPPCAGGQCPALSSDVRGTSRPAHCGRSCSGEDCPQQSSARPGDGRPEHSPSKLGEDRTAPFDPELALRFLKWREEKRRGRATAIAALPSAAEVRARIIRKVAAIKRHRAREAERAARDGDTQ